jgi:hypothetical protein
MLIIEPYRNNKNIKVLEACILMSLFSHDSGHAVWPLSQVIVLSPQDYFSQCYVMQCMHSILITYSSILWQLEFSLSLSQSQWSQLHCTQCYTTIIIPNYEKFYHSTITATDIEILEWFWYWSWKTVQWFQYRIF